MHPPVWTGRWTNAVSFGKLLKLCNLSLTSFRIIHPILRSVVRPEPNIPIESLFSQTMLLEILDCSGTPLFVKNRQHQLVLVNKALEELVGIDRNKMVGKTDFELYSPEEAIGFVESDDQVFESRKSVEYEEIITDSNNVSKTLRTHKNVIETSSGELLLVGTVHDITELRGTQTKLEDAVNNLSKIAHTDSLTGLPNRLQFELELERLISSNEVQQNEFSVAFIDLNGFKVINDTAGHHVGDEILRVCAKRLCNQLRESSMVARVGGDEFLLLLPDTDVETATRVVDRITASFVPPINFDGSSWHVSCSIGLAFYPSNGRTSSELIRNADFAMYEAKKHKRSNGTIPSSTVEFFCPQIGDAMEHRREIERAINFSEYSRDIEQYYQPIVSYDETGYQIKGFESLARWNLNGKNISPEEFIPILDNSGGIVPFGYKIIESACDFLARLDADQYVSVNLTHKQILDKDFCDIVTSTVRAAGINPNRLALELTEKDANIDKPIVLSVFKKLKRLGVRLMIDDFGSGYSNLGRIGELPIDVVKIDKSIIGDSRLLKSVLRFVHELGHVTIVEGVETEEVAKTALAFGADMLQGFYFGRPQPAAFDWKTGFMQDQLSPAIVLGQVCASDTIANGADAQQPIVHQ